MENNYNQFATNGGNFRRINVLSIYLKVDFISLRTYAQATEKRTTEKPVRWVVSLRSKLRTASLTGEATGATQRTRRNKS
ncbi:hypothetical protein LC605_06575 [Nostoc sp. CHAB 5836]|nr:hypothetical protein [Nostoc sp. CHAB 5836]